MLFTKTETLILELVVSTPIRKFTIREISRLIKKDLKIVHTSIQKLIQNKFLLKDEQQHLHLNYQLNIQELAYIENLRKEKFFHRYPAIKIAATDFLKKTKHSFFVLLVFGSYAEGNPRKDSDLDVLAILPDEDKNNSFERQLNAVLFLSFPKCHLHVISQASFKEMIAKRDEVNIINEALHKHIVIFGAESYYKLL
ncbi:MAG: nucleotidyltransferase domain-containing protein, partial [Nanoarchaeota archaeon]|nr:nucleotidyltransferase domain-containing protein [Nanoarchaeota archaeon]